MKDRESNFELLRIIATFLILAVHANYLKLGQPVAFDAHHFPLNTFTRIYIQNLSLVCVDVFILISGYFSIRPKVKGVLNLVFLCLYWTLSLWCIDKFSYALVARCGIAGIEAIPFPWNPIRGWFISAYFALYLLAPVLNAFVEKCEQDKLKTFLVVFFAAEIGVDLIVPIWGEFKHGYSVLSFMSLYLLGRYVARYQPGWTRKSSMVYLCAYGGIFFVSSVIQFFVLRYCNNRFYDAVQSFCMSYDSPIVIAGSLFLLLAFSGIHFHNKFINYVAGSCLGVFFFHTGRFFGAGVKLLNSYVGGGGGLLVALSIFLVCVYIAGTIIDQGRVVLWRLLCDVKAIGEFRNNKPC